MYSEFVDYKIEWLKAERELAIREFQFPMWPMTKKVAPETDDEQPHTND